MLESPFAKYVNNNQTREKKHRWKNKNVKIAQTESSREEIAWTNKKKAKPYQECVYRTIC